MTSGIGDEVYRRIYNKALDDAIEAVKGEMKDYTMPHFMMALAGAIAAIEKLREDKG
jgi:hypothetical protein